jgi:protein TonB
MSPNASIQRASVSRNYSCSFFSLVLHGSLLGAIYCIPTTKQAQRFDVSGSRTAFSIEVTVVSPPSIASLEIDGDDSQDDQPSKDKPPKEEIEPREMQSIVHESEPPPAQLAAQGPSFDPTPRFKPLKLERVEKSEPIEQKEDSQPHRPRVEASVAAPAVSIVLPPSQSLGLDDTSANLANNSPPDYPEHAYRNGLEGTVVLRLTIDAQGIVSMLEIVSSSGHESLDRAAMDAIKNWKGKPAMRAGRAIASQEVLPIRFKL